jgi:hypothetical protein
MKKENLHILSITSYINGDPIPEVQNFEDWKKYNNNQQGAYCRYINEENQSEHILYNWFVLNDERGVIPNEMRLADADVWSTIENILETNETLHLSLMKGYREIFGNFICKGTKGKYWSNITSERDDRKAIFYDMFHDITEIFTADCDKRLGLSILCVKD